MNMSGWAEMGVTIALAIACAWPMGAYLARLWNGQSTWLSPVLEPVERLFYRAAGVDERRQQGWFDYAMALLAFNAAGMALLYAILRLQGFLPLNPQGLPGLPPALAFNAAISFATNTDWQAFKAETSISHFSQMAGFITQNFVSAATGIAVAAALARAFAANRAKFIGNFWVDVTRASLYLLLPLSILTALALAALGAPQTLDVRVIAHTLEGARQVIALGPVASQQAINQIGVNGSGFFNANASHPFVNPSPLSSLVEAVAMNATAIACVVAFGRTLRMRAEARALIAAMTLLVTFVAGVMYYAETRPTPALIAAQVESTPNMEGKEVRFGAPASAVFAAMTTGSSDGAVNANHESFTPMAGGLAMFLMQLGEMLPGGAGSGMVSIVLMALLAVLVAGLMVGRTPQYLGKKVETREIKLVMLAILIVSFSILGLSAIAAVTPVALASLSTRGPHGLMEIMYAYASTAANNGSAFSGLKANTPYWNLTLGIAMGLGRFGFLIPALAVAGSLSVKPKLPPTEGTFPTDGPLFVSLLLGVIVILAGLQYFPSLALGPMAEQIEMQTLDRQLQGDPGPARPVARQAKGGAYAPPFE
jgi:K+-transporting ATPase ATPase A chain